MTYLFPAASVVVRCMDKADTIGETFASLRAQTVPVEIVVVDSGSTDGTLEIARSQADVVVEIPRTEFTFGGSLNSGAGRCSGSVVFALSAHCTLSTPTWVADSLACYAEPDVAATTGSLFSPDGSPLTGTYWPTLEEALRRGDWGFSNHACSFRADVWRDEPFRTDLSACEDREWSWRVLRAGWRIAVSPHLHVNASHRRAAGVRALYQRCYKESAALAGLGYPIHGQARDALGEWWHDFPYESRWPRPLRRLSPDRNVEIFATWRGGRSAPRTR